VLIGYKVEVQVKNGAIYEGIFHTMHFVNNEVDVVLKYAKLVRDPNAKVASEKDALAEKPAKTLKVPSSELVQIIAKDVRVTPEDLSGADKSEYGFETDASIGRGRGGNTWGRELQRWAPDEGDESSMFHLESDADAGGWDQFAVNRDKFGVESTFDELIYTTRLDRDKCGISEQEAARIAREIEMQGSNNVHLLEERGKQLDDSGIDEEERYSSVARTGQPHAAGDKRPRHAAGADGQGGPPPPPPPRTPAWGNLGAGVAAVAGRNSGLPPPPPPAQQRQAPAGASPSSSGGTTPASSTGGAATTTAPISIPSSAGGVSTPIDIDPQGLRREANKVRTQLAQEIGAAVPKKDRSSPYGTPKGTKSPLQSPLIGDPEAMRALNLIPGTTPIDEETRKEFLRFKAQQGAAQQAGAQASALTSSLDKKAPLIDDFKKFSTSLSAPKVDAKPPADAAASSSPAAAAAPAPAAAAEGAAKADGGSAADSKAADAAPKKSSLNPFAKPFTLNVNAKTFVPGGSSSTGSSAAAAGSGATGAGPAIGHGHLGAGGLPLGVSASSNTAAVAPVHAAAAAAAAVVQNTSTSAGPAASTVAAAGLSGMPHGVPHHGHHPHTAFTATGPGAHLHHAPGPAMFSGPGRIDRADHSRSHAEGRDGAHERGRSDRDHMGGMGPSGPGGHVKMGSGGMHHTEPHKGGPGLPHGPMHQPLEGMQVQAGPGGMPAHGVPTMGPPMQAAVMPPVQTYMMPAPYMTQQVVPGGMMAAPPGSMMTPGGPVMYAPRPGMAPGGGMMVPVPYPAYMPIAGPGGPGARPPFYPQGAMPMGAMPMPVGGMPMMGGPMPPMAAGPHDVQRMGGAGGPMGMKGGRGGPGGNRAGSGPPRSDGSFQGGAHHHGGHAPHAGGMVSHAPPPAPADGANGDQ